MSMRVDWSAVLGDIAYLLGEPDGTLEGVRVPCSQNNLADSLGMPRGTLRGWMDGSEPRYSDGERLLDRWCELTGKARIFAPQERRSLSAAGR